LGVGGGVEGRFEGGVGGGGRIVGLWDQIEDGECAEWVGTAGVVLAASANTHRLLIRFLCVGTKAHKKARAKGLTAAQLLYKRRSHKPLDASVSLRSPPLSLRASNPYHYFPPITHRPPCHQPAPESP